MMQRAETEIVRADIADIPEIARIEQECIPNGWSEKGFYDFLSSPFSVIFKAVSQGETVGFANARYAADEGELLNIAVYGSFRRQGVASQLLSALEYYFRRNNINSIFLEVREQNLGALRFYEKHGFERVGLRKNYYQCPDDNAVIMKRVI